MINTFKNFVRKPFPHFDPRLNISKQIIRDLQNPSYIASHSFYPFIHYQMVSRKFSKKKGLSNPKIRDIYYAAHMDGYIYKMYADKLSFKYNELCNHLKIDDVVLAYRNNKKGRNNIHFSAEVIEFISKQENAFIFVSDFTKYFDRLDHKILKGNIIKVLDEGELLSDDWWNVFKHITNFNSVEKEDVEEYVRMLGRDPKDKELERYFSPKEFRDFRRNFSVNKHLESFGIPQGTAISAVLANIYAFEFDIKMKDYATKFSGIYRRYSDDIIMVIPLDEIYSFDEKSVVDYIQSLVNENKIEMGLDKTSTLYLSDNKIFDSIDLIKESKIDYLGFSFNGSEVQIREKSLYKYYHRAYKKVKAIKVKSESYKRKVGRRKLYSLYTHLGRNYKGYGNFISYARRAHIEFSKNPRINSRIYNQYKRHWTKINSRLKKDLD